MSYRNPKQFVDTQTAQYYRNLQKTMTGITDDYINTIKQKQAAETKRLKEIAKINNDLRIKQENYRSRTGQALNNATGDRPDIFKNPEVQGQFINAIDTTSDLMYLPVLNAEQRVYKDNVAGLSKTIVEDLTNLEALGGDYQEKDARGNSMGGISPYNDPNQRAAVASIFTQGVGGKNKFSFDLSQPGGAETRYTYIDDKGETYTYTGSELNGIIADPKREIIVTIPDETTNMQRISDTFGYETDREGKPTSKIKQRYYEGQKEEVVINEKGDKEYFVNANEDLFVQDIKQEVIANVDALLRPNQLALWNYFQDTSVDDKKGKDDKVLFSLDHKFENEEEEQEFLDQLSASYSTYLARKYFLGNKRVVTRTEKIKQPEKTRKLTEGDIKRLDYKDKLEYLDNRFDLTSLTFDSVFQIANNEGIQAVKEYADEDADEPSQIKVGKIIILPTDDSKTIKKKLLIASGIKAKDAQAIIEESIDVSGPSAPRKAQAVISSSRSINPLLNK
jgi:hypothetical protein